MTTDRYASAHAPHPPSRIDGPDQTPILSPAPDKAEDILAEAQRIVCGARRAAYGTPEDNFKRIADLWNTYLKQRRAQGDITTGDVALMMVLMKIARLAESPAHRDSVVDMAGYAACYARCAL